MTTVTTDADACIDPADQHPEVIFDFGTAPSGTPLKNTCDRARLGCADWRWVPPQSDRAAMGGHHHHQRDRNWHQCPPMPDSRPDAWLADGEEQLTVAASLRSTQLPEARYASSEAERI